MFAVYISHTPVERIDRANETPGETMNQKTAIATALMLMSSASMAATQTYAEDFESLSMGVPASIDYGNGGGESGVLTGVGAGTFFTGTWAEGNSVRVLRQPSVLTADKFLELNTNPDAMTFNMTFLAAASSVTVSFRVTGTQNADPLALPTPKLATGFSALSNLDGSAWTTGTVSVGDSNLSLAGASNPNTLGDGTTYTYTFANVAVGAHAFTIMHAGAGSLSLDEFRVTAVPEPQSLAVMLAGLAAVVFVKRRRDRSGF